MVVLSMALLTPVAVRLIVSTQIRPLTGISLIGLGDGSIQEILTRL